MATGQLDDAGANRIVQEVLSLAAASDDAIRVLFAMHGDELDPAFAVYDVVSTVSPRIHMVATGRVAGAGVVAFCGVPIDDRTCLPMARFHLHEFRFSTRNGSRAREAAQDATEQRKRVCDLLSEATGMPPSRIDEDLHVGCQLDAREAETYGLVSRLTMRGEL